MSESEVTQSIQDWDDYFFNMAKFVSTKGKDTFKVGCVLVGPHQEVRSTGFNGFCRGVDESDSLRHDPSQKLIWTEHAERNAIYNAARHGTPTDQCTIYSTFFPCADCARAIIQSGIKRVIAPDPFNRPESKWFESFTYSKAMLNESGVKLNYVE
jgi:dCMP deaminase